MTVSTVHREWGAMCRRQHSYVPALRLNGEWLRKAGFAAGKKVQVSVRAGMIVITTLVLPS
jgi:Toxin SymE, type I toxin-antitoxin system